MRGILGLWRQFGNEARLHLNTSLSEALGKLDERRIRASGETEREREMGEREQGE